MDAGDLEARVREHLQAGETFRAAIWASRADGRTSIEMSRREISPFRFRRPVPEGRWIALPAYRPRTPTIAVEDTIDTGLRLAGQSAAARR